MPQILRQGSWVGTVTKRYKRHWKCHLPVPWHKGFRCESLAAMTVHLYHRTPFWSERAAARLRCMWHEKWTSTVRSTAVRQPTSSREAGMERERKPRNSGADGAVNERGGGGVIGPASRLAPLE